MSTEISKSFTRLIFKDNFFRISSLLAWFINLGIWLLIRFRFIPIINFSDPVPLHYNIYFGIDFMGEWYKLMVMPMLGIFFIVTNFLLADIIYLRDKVTSYLLLGASVFAQILLLVGVYMVILINQ